MTKEDCVIYEGLFFQIEWYFDAKGNSQPFDYFQECDLTQKRKFLMLCQRMGDFRKGKKIIVTNAYKKSGDKLPKSQKELAVKNRADYLLRNSETKEDSK